MNAKNSVTTSHFLPENTLLLNAITEGVYGFDLNGNAVFINPAAEQMTGWKSAELIGKNIHDCHHHSHADSLKRINWCKMPRQKSQTSTSL